MKSPTPLCEITATARMCLSGSWGKSIGILFVYILILALIAEVPIVGPFIQLIFTAPLVVGLRSYFLATVNRQANTFDLLFSGFDRFWTAILAQLLVGLIIVAWTVPFVLLGALLFGFVHVDLSIFPAYTMVALQGIVILLMCCFLILIQMRYYFVLFIVADDPTVSAMEAIRRSVDLMRDNYWRLGLFWLRFVGWQLLAMLTFGIGMIWLVPYISASTAAFYYDLKDNG